MAFSTITDIAAFCRRKGFVFPSSEIYGGFAAVYDYGPYGVELKNNLSNHWWRHVVQNRRDVVGLDSGIFMAPRAWDASGHTDSFDDPQVDCRGCRARHRADILLATYGVDVEKASIEEINEQFAALNAGEKKVVCPNCGSADLTPARRFSLMVKSNLGAPTDELSDENAVFLRPETCQGIFLNYLNVLNSTRCQVPFGIAQAGKAFRNEIVARQFIFRTREFEQMEMQYFAREAEVEALYESWRAERLAWYGTIGIPADRLRCKEHERLAHYASAACDIEYQFACLDGRFNEIEGIHMRGEWDLGRHQEFSGANMFFHDPKTNEKFLPHVVETSAGLNRIFLMVLDSAYCEEQLEDGKSRAVLKLHPRLSPVKVAVFPLVRNKPELTSLAERVFSLLAPHFTTEWDHHSNVGKRYRRQDEIGTPCCVTVDFDSLENDTVTVRSRDTMEQTRVSIDALRDYISAQIEID